MSWGNRLVLLALALGGAATPGCRCVETEYVYVCDADTAPDAAVDGPPDAPLDAPDAALPDAAIDAPLDAPPDATPACVGAGDTAAHVEWLGGAGGTPQMTVDGFGATAAISTGGSTSRLVRVGADGRRRAPDLDLAIAVAAIAFDGTRYWVSSRGAGNAVEVRTVASDGTLGAATAVGTGRPISGALAVHASGDVALLWRASADGSLRATVLPAGGGAPIETVLDATAGGGVVDDLGGVTANQAASPRFVAAYVHDVGADHAVEARALAPAGAAVTLSSGPSPRERVQPTPGAVPDTALVTWRDGAAVHAAIVDENGAIVLADRTLATVPTGHWYTRVAGRSGPGSGFEVMIDVQDLAGNDRWLERHAFDASATAVGTPVRVATICTDSYSEENLPFVRNTDVRYAIWFDLSLPANVIAAF